MRLHQLSKHSVYVIDGQCNTYDCMTNTHTRSYLCFVMPEIKFIQICEKLRACGVMMVTQSMRDGGILKGDINLKDIVWLTKVKNTGTHYLTLTQDTIRIDRNMIYVVMWKKRFVSKILLAIFGGTMRGFDIDYMLEMVIENGDISNVLIRFLYSIFA